MMKKELLNEIIYEKQNLKYFYILSLMYLAVLMISLTVSARLMPFHIPWTHFTILLTSGTLIIPFSFFIQDIITEVYGYTKGKKLIQISICILFLYIFYLKVTTFFPIPSIENIDEAYNTVFSALPKHLLALFSAIFIGNLVNDYLLSQSKKYFCGQHLAFRLIISSALGALISQFIGTLIAWYGSLHFTDQIIPFIFFSYLYKLIFEIIMTPFNVYICRWLKNAEGIDVYDKKINYNPFSLK